MADETPFTTGTPSAQGPPLRRSDLAALVQLLRGGGQGQSPYQLQFEAPTIAGPERDPSQDFQSDWDQAMASYQARLANPRILASGITFAGQGGNLDTPEAAFQSTVAPLRFQASEFSPGISRAITEADLEKQRQAELAAQSGHWRALEKQANDRAMQAQIARQFRDSEARDRLEEQRQRSAAEIALRKREFDLRERVARQNNPLLEPSSIPTEQQQEDVSQIPTSQIIEGLRSVPRSGSPIPAATDVVPSDPKKRVAGQRYVLPKGIFTWTGTGWTQ